MMWWGGGKREEITLLSATELLDALLVVVFTIETHANAYSRVVFDALPPLIVRVLLVGCLLSIALALNHQSATSSRYKFLKNIGEFF